MNKTFYNNLQLNCLFESGGTANPLDEILVLASQICPRDSCRTLRRAHTDVTAFFSGQYPGFEASITKYHNLRHTYSVVLAAIRLFHGLHHEGQQLAPERILQGLLSAYFHDTGLLPQNRDEAQNGAVHARDHEQRSMAILDRYLRENSFPGDYSANCATMIKYTMLDWHISDDQITDDRLHLCGQVLGTADLLAQMADRYYLESLPLLFQEHKASGIDKHSSAIELMKNTIDFHEEVVKKRLDTTLGDIAAAMRTHFRARWKIDRNLYLENIQLNLDYLRKITEDCSLDLSCWGKYLRRIPPSTAL